MWLYSPAGTAELQCLAHVGLCLTSEVWVTGISQGAPGQHSTNPEHIFPGTEQEAHRRCC